MECKLDKIKDELIEYIDEETSKGLKYTNGTKLEMAVDMVKDIAKANYHFKLIEAMDTEYSEENFNRHIKCLRRMAENATQLERQNMIQHLNNLNSTLQQMR